MKTEPVTPINTSLVWHAGPSNGAQPDHGMSFGLFIATEGGRKCPMCGKYAKRSELGNLSFKTEFRQGWAHITMYGHLPGYGCNSPDNADVEPPRK